MKLRTQYFLHSHGVKSSGFFRALFTWREGAPANRATRLEGLKHSPPLHATHLTGTVSGLRVLSFERPLSTTNLTADQGNFFFILFQLPARAGACSLPETRLLHYSLQTDFHSVRQITLANGNALISGHPGGLTPGKPRAFAPSHLQIPPTQGQYSSTKATTVPLPGA